MRLIVAIGCKIIFPCACAGDENRCISRRIKGIYILIRLGRLAGFVLRPRFWFTLFGDWRNCSAPPTALDLYSWNWLSHYFPIFHPRVVAYSSGMDIFRLSSSVAVPGTRRPSGQVIALRSRTLSLIPSQSKAPELRKWHASTISIKKPRSIDQDQDHLISPHNF